MKQFFKMMFASAFGVFVAAILLMCLSIVTLIGMAASMESPAYKPKPNTVYKIDLTGTLSDQAPSNPFAELFGEKEKPLALKDLLYSIKQAKENSNIKGIYLNAKSLAAGSASLEAIRRALIDFKESGKFVVAYADTYTQGSYYLCSVADKVYLNPQGILGIQGLASESIFFKNLLDKIGVKMEVFKVGTYKGAVEPFILDKLSEANREQITSYVNSIWNNLCKGIAESRNISVETVNQFANEGVFFGKPEKAVEMGFIDELKYKSEVEEYIKELAGQTDDRLKTAGYNKVSTIASKEKEKKNQIAVLYAEGEIVEQKGEPSPFKTEQNITGKLADELIKLKDDDKVKAVVLRVNSPGGSAFVSDQIWRQVVELKKVKPIVVSMGDVAASGGYYISCAANKIIAEPNTLTGSIGIFGRFPNATGLLDKVGITTDVVKTNTYADMGDISRPMREDERALLQAFIERGYDTFLTRCADGRGMTKEEIDKVGQGRVWTGEQAIKIGLVDELGGINHAIETAAKLAEVTDYSVTSVSGSKDFITTLLEKQLEDVKVSMLKSFLGEEYEQYAALQKAKKSIGIQARLPYDIKPL